MKSIDIYEDLYDGFLYTARSWLKIDLAEATENEGREICASAAFLFGYIFLKDNPGQPISALLAKELGHAYQPNHLSNLATKMRLAMSGSDFAQGTSPLREYIQWVQKYEPTVQNAFLDDAGKLALVTAEEITNLFLRENDAQKNHLHVSEIVFLTVTDKFYLFFMDTIGKEKFRTYRSFPYFESVHEEMDRIRREPGE
ncbi:MAG: hypothetical protein SPG64_02200 [Candidatus Enteromonas sp.]|nr:hypothetical protein [Candidatus Enteromonas sp.]